jgi:glycosyltransferase involved in cell wall biosynthesis
LSPLNLVSIGVPTYNGAAFLESSLRSLTGQDHADIEIIVSDNGSTDGTVDVAKEVANTDSRIRIITSQRNQGAVANFNQALTAAVGDFFMWASDHDVWAPTFVSRCLNELMTQPDVVLTYPKTQMIDESGDLLGVMDDHVALMDPNPLNRYRTLIWNLTWCNMVYGLHRRDSLIRTGGFQKVWAPDHVLLARIVLMGKVSQLPDVLYFRRRNRPEEDERSNRVRVLEDLAPGDASMARLSDMKLWGELSRAHVRAVVESDLPTRSRLRGTMGTCWCFKRRFGVPIRQSLAALRDGRREGREARVSAR